MNFITRKWTHIYRKFFSSSKYARHCPVCDANVDIFIPLPKQYRVNVVVGDEKFPAFDDAEMLNATEYSCPECTASDRERLYALYINKYFLPDVEVNAQKVVHFAPEAALRKFLHSQSFAEYRTADLMMQGVDDKVDLTNLARYSDDYFDFFVCSHMLEHIIDDVKAMQELYRILSPQGRGILVVPIFPSLDEIYEDGSMVTEEQRLRHFGQEDHVRMYNKHGYLNRLSGVGFKVREYGIADFSVEEFTEFGIHVKSIVYIVAK